MNTTTPKEMEEKGKILIIDDNEDVLFALKPVAGALHGED